MDSPTAAELSINTNQSYSRSYSMSTQCAPQSESLKYPSIHMDQLRVVTASLCKSRPDIMAATSFAATKSKSPTQHDFDELYYVVEYLRATQHLGHVIKKCNNGKQLQLHCEVDASYLLHEDSKGHSGYTIAFNAIGTWYNRSSKQTLVTTSSTHSEMRAIFTLVKDILYVLAILRNASTFS
mmetsp:Transcript_25886/g.37125  ORF Transcript_25886/g.37125 Transcript_25886/m.37125 type:complete len:182 (-) Transcript_25886:883-1428(-)